MANDVTTTRPEYDKANAWRWPMVRDICAGSEAVKARGDAYLPRPNATDQSAENLARYTSYLARAVFYNATGRTRDGLIGAVYRLDPSLTVPTGMDYIKKDIDGAGNSIYQQSQAVLGDVLETGRAFLLTDYPSVSGSTSRLDQQSGGIRATVTSYPAESVINWRTERVGAEHLLSLVVLKEHHEEPDGYGMKCVDQYRVLSLGIPLEEADNPDAALRYHVEVIRQTADNKAWETVEDYWPTNSAGQPWDRITGTFVGAQNNDSSIDSAPLYDLAELNLGHYRNSADYEDAAFLCGQPQPWMSGLDEAWRDHMEEQGIYLGSRAPWLLPQNAACGVWQAQPNSMVKEAMDAKEAQMVALGARLIERGSANKTATQADAENAAEHSVLSLVAANVSEAYNVALGFMAQYNGTNGTIEFRLNQDFVEAALDAQMLTALVSAWQAGALAQPDLFALLRKFGLVKPEKTDQEILDELEAAPAGLNLDNANGNVATTG